eukprot:1773150-Rhodomonas_salina.1
MPPSSSIAEFSTGHGIGHTQVLPDSVRQYQTWHCVRQHRACRRARGCERAPHTSALIVAYATSVPGIA